MFWEVRKENEEGGQDFHQANQPTKQNHHMHPKNKEIINKQNLTFTQQNDGISINILSSSF